MKKNPFQTIICKFLIEQCAEKDDSWNKLMKIFDMLKSEQLIARG